MRTSVVVFLALICLHVTSAQGRRNFRNGGGPNRGRRNFQSHRPQQMHLQHFSRAVVYERERRIIAPDNCPHMQLTKQINDRVYGNLVLNTMMSVRGINLEIEYDRAVVGFVNNFAHSSSADSRLFTIKDEMREFKRGDDFIVEFFVNIDQRFPPPIVTKLKLNGKQLCPREHFDDECASLEMITNETGGRYDGALTIYPHQIFNNARRIDFEFDSKAWAVGNDLGESVTKDQKHFTIFNNNIVNSGHPLTINFFVKFDEFEELPKLRSLYVDDVLVCLPPHNRQAENMERSNFHSTLPPPFNRSESNMLLTDLPFDSFPSVTNSPQQVHNSEYECGFSGSVLTSRVNDGFTAHLGQFPFHVAVFFDFRYRCGASLIAETAVVTASHCVVDSSQQNLPVEKFHLFFGSIDLKSLNGDEALRQVARIIKHPNYQHDKILKQDIALAFIKGNLQFSKFIQPICLPHFLPADDKDMTVVGYGSSTESLKLSRYLHYGKMMVISREKCTEKLILALLPEQSTFCAKAKNEMLACPGDSGGGIVHTVNGKFYLRGIASVTLTEANGRCNADNPVAFTDVHYFAPWINESMNFAV